MSERLPTPGPGVLATPFGAGALVVYAPQPGRVQVLNPSAALVWAGCVAGGTVVDLVDAIVEATGEPAERIGADVTDCLAVLRERRLVVDDEPREAPGPAGPPVAGRVEVTEVVSEAVVSEAPPPLGRTVGPFAVVDRRVQLVGAAADADHGALLERAARLLDDLAVPPAGAGTRWVSTPEGPLVETVVVERRTDGEVRQWGPGAGYRSFAGEDAWIHALPTELNRLLVAQRGCLVLHAAALVSPAGATVVLPAASGSGKSTLAALAVRAGWRYVSDEAVGLRFADLAVVPYPKPLVLDEASRAAVGAPSHLGDNVGVADLGGTAVGPGVALPPPVAAVVPRYRPDAPARTVRLDPVDALERLAPEVLNLQAAGVEGLAALARVATGVSCTALEHPGGEAALGALGRLVVEAATAGGAVPTAEHEKI